MSETMETLEGVETSADVVAIRNVTESTSTEVPTPDRPPRKQPTKSKGNGKASGKASSDAATPPKAPTPARTKTRAKTAAKAPAIDPRTYYHAAVTLKQASDPTRLQVLLMLADGEQHVSSICGELSQSQPAVSHHIALLRFGGLVEPRRAGKHNFYRLTEAGTKLAGVVRGVMA